MGIDTEEAYGYKVVEPVIRLRKPGVRVIAKALGLPDSISERPPFPGPALTARVIGEATRERIVLVRKATSILEAELAAVKAFQYMAILHNDRVTGMRDNKREFGQQIEIRWVAEVHTFRNSIHGVLLDALYQFLCQKIPALCIAQVQVF